MKAKLIYESLEDILKPKLGDPDTLFNEVPDIKKNNERVKYLFSGDVSKILNLSENLIEFNELKIKELEEKYLELLQIAVHLDNKDMINFINKLLDKYYDHPWGGRKYGGNHFDHMREKIKGLWHKESVAKFLNYKFYDICKNFLDKLDIKMIDPKISHSIIICSLNKVLSEDKTEELMNILKDKRSKYMFFPNKGGNDSIYPYAYEN